MPISMKNYYVIKDDGFSKFYTNKEFRSVLEYMEQNPSALMKGFYYMEDAQRFYNKKSPVFYYVVKASGFSKICNGIKEANTCKQKDKEREIVTKTRNIDFAMYIDSISYETYIERKEIEKNREKTREKRKRRKIRKIRNRLENIKFNEKYIAFMDCEANRNQAISVGFVVYDNQKNKIVDQYYSLIRPRNFNELETHIKNMTKLTNEEIKKAPPLEAVIEHINLFMKKYEIENIYTWGTEDKRFIENHNIKKAYSVSYKIKDIQQLISSSTFDVFHNNCMSLANMKQLYHLDTERVTHNALSDTIDLAHVFKAWRKNKKLDFDIEFIN